MSLESGKKKFKDLKHNKLKKKLLVKIKRKESSQFKKKTGSIKKKSKKSERVEIFHLKKSLTSRISMKRKIRRLKD